MHWILNISIAEWGVITNSILAILTFFALMLSMWTVIINSYHKGKFFYKKDNSDFFPKYIIKLYNKRVVPITVIHRGFYIKKEESRPVICGTDAIVKLEMSDVSYFEVVINELNKELLAEGYVQGDEIKLYGFFLCANGKRYEKRIKHIVSNVEPILTIRSQTSQ